MSLKFMKSAVSADDPTFQIAVKGSLHQSPPITSPASNALDETRIPTAAITDPVGADYLMAARSTDLVLTSGQDILFNDVFNHSTMAYNPATGLFDTHNEETYSIHAHLVVTAANADFTIDLVDSANTIIDAVRKCIVGTRAACDISFVSHSHSGNRQLKLRITTGTGNITIKTGSSICVEEVGVSKLRTDLASVTLEWYAEGGTTPLVTSAVITKTAGEWPASVTATGLLPSIASVEVLAKGVSTAGFTVAASARQLYKTKLDKLITLTGLTGTNNLVRVLVGESSGAVVKDFHCNGNSRKFPAAAGDGGDFRFRNSGDTADLVFYVSAVSGVTPNRVATCLVAVDAPTGIIIRGEGGPSQASRATAYVQLNYAGTGGTITTTGDDIVHTFNAGGNLVVPNGVRVARALVVGGGTGGDGGVTGAVYGHGGGGGRVTSRSAHVLIPGSTYTVVVGVGSAAAAMNGTVLDAGQSSLGTLIAAGGVHTNNWGSNGNGGSSGRDVDGVITNTGGGADGAWGAAGGGGAGSDGGQSLDDAIGGARGAGLASDITGSSIVYGAGGAGSGTATTAPAASPANVGRAGDGHGTSPQAGGSGVVIVRYTPYIIGAFASDNG